MYFAYLFLIFQEVTQELMIWYFPAGFAQEGVNNLHQLQINLQLFEAVDFLHLK